MSSQNAAFSPAFPATRERPLAGKLALVTGGGIRVGRAICEELARAGAQLAVHCNTSRSAAEEVARQASGSFVVQADLRDAKATAEMFAQAVAKSQSGAVDLLVNSAAIFVRTPFAAMTDEDWDNQLAINLTAPQRCMRLAVARGVTSIVNLVDIGAWQPWRKMSAYSVSKAGLLHLTKILARELAPRVRVNAVAPGTVLFPDDYDEPARARVLARIPLAKEGHPDDAARAVRFLLCEPYLTGVCLPVDGGQGLSL